MDRPQLKVKVGDPSNSPASLNLRAGRRAALAPLAPLQFNFNKLAEGTRDRQSPVDPRKRKGHESSLVEHSQEKSRKRVRSLDHKIQGLVGRPGESASQHQVLLSKKLGLMQDSLEFEYKALRPTELDPVYAQSSKKLGYYHKMERDKLPIRDREEREIVVNDRSYVFGRFDNRMKQLPLKIYLTSTHVSWEFYVDFNRYPDFDNYELKSVGNGLVVGDRYAANLLTDTSIRFMFFSFGKCRVKVRAEFYLSIPPAVDLGVSRLERLKNLQPFYKIELQVGSRQAAEARTRSMKSGSRSSQACHRVSEILSGSLAADLEEGTGLADSVNLSYTQHPGPEESLHQSSTLSVGLFFYARRGLKRKIQEQVLKTNSRIEQVQRKKQQLCEESRSRVLSTFASRHSEARVNPLEVMSVLTDKVLRQSRLRNLVVHLYLAAALNRIDSLAKRHKGRASLMRTARVVHRLVVLSRMIRAASTSKQARVQTAVRCGLQLHCRLVSQRLARQEACSLLGLAFKSLSHQASLISLVSSTQSTFDTIFNRVRRHYQTVADHRTQFELALDQVLDNLPSCVQTDADFSGAKLRYFVNEMKDDIFFYLFNSSLMDYLRRRIDWICREEIEAGRPRTAEERRLYREAVDQLRKVSTFATLERRLRLCTFHQLSWQFKANLASPAGYAAWPTAAQRPGAPVGLADLKLSPLQKPRGLSRSLMRPEDLEHHEQMVESMAGKANERRRQVFKKLKAMFQFQRFSLKFNPATMTCLVYTLWMHEKKNHQSLKQD